MAKLNQATRLRELMARQTIVMPGAFNALTAMQIERVGFSAVYVSGAAISASRGLPDVGLLSLTEVVSDAKAIADAVTIPVLVDVDTGFGEPLNVMRTVRACEDAGLAGIQIEDQENPKKCGHLPGKQVIPLAAMTMKVGAAVEARNNSDFVIVARTDARAVEGFDAVVRRARAYANAGADVIFPEALESADEFRLFTQALLQEGVKVPLLANMTEFGKTPFLTVKEFEALGYRIIVFPVSSLRIAAKAVEKFLFELKALGTQRESVSSMQTRAQLYELLRYAEYERQDVHVQERYGRTGQNGQDSL